MKLISLLLFTTLLFSEQETCLVEDSVSNRSIYSIGDTLSIDDQNILFPVCNGSGNYSTGDSFSFSDLDGKITLISMNATW